MKIKAIKFSPDEIDNIETMLKTAAQIISQDAPLDWEMREHAARNIWDAREAINEAKTTTERIAQSGIAHFL
jgi:hypothetical protein